jgi:amino acid adenylation domain-containing protein
MEKPRSTSLSLSQREIWLDQRAWPDSVHLHIGGGGFLEGPLNLALLKQALSQLVAEHDTLRLVPQLDGTQFLLGHFEPSLETVNLQDVGDHQQAMQTWWQARISVPFDLGVDPPWRFALLCVRENLHGVVMQFHHLVMDGWGTSLVMQRWSAIYNALYSTSAAGVKAALAAEASYLSFIVESKNYLNSDAFARDADYWLQQFTPQPEPLLARRPGTHRQGPLLHAHGVVKSIARKDFNRLKDHCARSGTSPFNFFLCALVLYFSRVCNRQDIVVGVPTLNRGGRRYRETLGMFVGMMPVVVRLTPEMTVSGLIAHVGSVMRGALRHPRFPMSELARKLGSANNGHDRFFDVLLSFERQNYQLNFGDATATSSRQLFSGIARYPLGITVCEFHDEADVELVFEASPAYFSKDEAQLLGERLWDLVLALMDAHENENDASLQALCIASPLQHTLPLESSTPAEPPPDTFVVQFERQAARQPSACALVWDAGSMDYTTLNGQANLLALRLIQLGVVRNDIVALAIARSADMVIAILAIAKTGAAFLPLDPDAPVARLREIIQDSVAAALLVQGHSLPRLAGLHARCVAVDEDFAVTPPEGLSESEFLRRCTPSAHDLAYVLFTSGSTGRPKGVMVEHAALARRIDWLARAFEIKTTDRTAQATQITFDPSLIELCLPLALGASIALPPPGRVMPESLASFAELHGVTVMAFVPSTLVRFVDAAAGLTRLKLRVACCGGEVLSPALAVQFVRQTGARLFNLYGPTEATIFATAWECLAPTQDEALPQTLPVGGAASSTIILILDAQRQPLPSGVTGDIYIGGQALARGYLHRPDLTQAAFFDDPLHNQQRLYRTGDRGWLAPDGNLHFVGRMDRQVKLRGYRIELGEIEAALSSISGVQQAAVKLIDRHSKPALYAWVATGGAKVTGEHIQSALRQHLPSYMIPGGISLLRALPESTVGKLDYAALPEPEFLTPDATAQRQPQSPLEAQLLALWQDILKQPGLSVSDNFFEVGGDSLAAISMLAGIEKLVGRRVPMYLITERPTVEGLASALSQESAPDQLLIPLEASTDPARSPTAPLPFFLAASGHGDFLRFQNLARAMAGSCDMRMLQPPGASTISTTADLAGLYVSAILEHRPQACYLAGFSVGGLAALETAVQMQQAGVEVRALVLIDTIYPSRLWGGTLLWKLLVWSVRTLQIQDLSMNGRRLGAMLKDPGLVGQVLAVSGYRPSEFKGTVHLIKSTGLASTWDRLLFSGWRTRLGQALVTHTVKGMHGSMFDDVNVDALAQAVQQILQQAPKPAADIKPPTGHPTALLPP